jgi:phage tail-like protein
MALLDNVDATGKISKSVYGRRRDPVGSSSFVVTIQDLARDYFVTGENPDQIGFTRISGIGSSIETIDVVQGSSPAKIAVPTSITYSDVNFERGITIDGTAMALFQWYRDIQGVIFNAPSVGAQSAGASSGIEGIRVKIKRRRVTIQLAGFEIVLVDAWPTSLLYGDMDAITSGIWVSSMTMKYRGIEIKALPTTVLAIGEAAEV